jgi:hypothetical protein
MVRRRSFPMMAPSENATSDERRKEAQDMTMLNEHWTLGPSTEDLAIGRLIRALRRRTARKPKAADSGHRPGTRAIRSSGAVAEWHAMGRTF